MLPAALLALVALVTTACDGSGADSEAVPGSATYVAIGDSSSSGVLIPQVADEACARSTNNYASRLARALEVDVADVTCAGAQTRHVSSDQEIPDSRGGGTAEPQIAAVGPQTRLVTIGLGRNDGGLFLVITRRCLTAGAPVRLCLRRLEEIADDAALRRTGAAMRDAVELVRRRASPGAAIVLVDYLRFVDLALGCERIAGVEPRSLAAVADVQRRLNLTLAAAAADSGALFLDLRNASAAHGLCSDEPWVNDGVTEPGVAKQWHPLPSGHAAMARLLEELLEENGVTPTP